MKHYKGINIVATYGWLYKFSDVIVIATFSISSLVFFSIDKY